MRFALPAAVLLLAACETAPLPADRLATLDPVAFFSGQSRGEGTLDQIFEKPRSLRVESIGRPTRDGLLLRQRIWEEGKPPRVRTWQMRPVAPGRYAGKLTPDATGPVSIRVEGPRAFVRYDMKGGLEVRQQLALQADRRTLLNDLRVYKWGIPVAQIEEVIRKLR